MLTWSSRLLVDVPRCMAESVFWQTVHLVLVSIQPSSSVQIGETDIASTVPTAAAKKSSPPGQRAHEDPGKRGWMGNLSYIWGAEVNTCGTLYTCPTSV